MKPSQGTTPSEESDPVANVVKKGAGRPAAAAKRAKAAQRTPLPPKVKPIPLHPKAQEFIDDAIALKWKHEVVVDGDVMTATATRGPERIVIRWTAKAFTDALYSCENRTVTVRNVSAARKQMAIPAAEAVETSRKTITHTVKARKAAPVEDDDDDDVKPRLPFDPEMSPSAEILAALVGKEIIWRNGITGMDESARVLKVPVDKQNHLKIDTKRGRRILTFCSDTDESEKMQGIRSGAFHSVYLDRIKAVR